ncbi:MAG: replication factor C large subunit, partial [Homavirus sp.]
LGKLKFTTDLNKTSIKKINKKNINNTNKCFKDMNIFDYIYINKIIRKLIENGNIKECVEILKEYDIKLEHIESLLKIDKIETTKSIGLKKSEKLKTNLSSKQKKEFSKYLKN